MKSSNLIRLSGLALVLGGLLAIVGSLLEPDSGGLEYATDPLTVSSHLLGAAAVLLVMLGLPGLFAFQAERAGILGLIGTVALFFCFPLLDLTHDFVDAAVRPALAAIPEAAPLLAEGGPFDEALARGPVGNIVSLAGPALLLGLILLGVATIQAGVLPRWTGALLIVAALSVPLGFVVPALEGVAFAFPYAALGCAGLALVVVAGRRASFANEAVSGHTGSESRI